jgi:predicted secreted protein
MHARLPNRNGTKLDLPGKAGISQGKAGEEMTEDTATTWKELAGVGGMEVHAVSGMIVVRDAKTSQCLVFSEADYAIHRRRIVERSGPLVLLRFLQRATNLMQLAQSVLELEP